jgi:UDP-3-O-[3-hydroxymyristoyl] glucosamine N-acyltransferase
MAAAEGGKTLGELAAAVDGAPRGDPALRLTGVNGLADAGPTELSFYNNPRYRDALERTRAGAVLCAEESLPLLGGRPAIVASDPYLAFARASAVFHPRPAFPPGVDPRAVVEPTAAVDPTATVMAFAYVGAGARVGPRAVLFPHVFVGAESVVGADALLYPGVVLRERCSVGERVVLQPGAVVGGDGFGYAFDAAGPAHVKIPQAGTAVIEDDVEVGANATIDRATLGQTRIGRGSKLDNLVQVGHNVKVGPLCILCGQAGIAGSSELGAGVVLGGQVGLANHLAIGDGVRLGAQSGVMSDLLEPGDYLGSPAMPSRDFLKATAAFRQGASTLRRLRELTRRVEALERQLARGPDREAARAEPGRSR